MNLTNAILISSLVYSVLGENNTFAIDSIGCGPLTFQYLDTHTNEPINRTEVCIKKPCITKCCPKNQILFKNISGTNIWCGDSTHLKVKYPDVDIYENNINEKIVKSKKQLDEFTMIYSDGMLKEPCSIDIVEELLSQSSEQPYILENGTIAIKRINYINQWIMNFPPEIFCVEYQMGQRSDGFRTEAVKLVMRMYYDPDYDGARGTDQKTTLTAYGMLVSCVFLVLVLVVYSLLPQLRNLAGIMLMAYVTTLTVAFIFRAVQVITTNRNELTRIGCLYVGFIFYYSLLASFTWMNVMSFDIWWSMRGFRKLKQIHRHGILVKFCWYSLYGWGAPLVPVLFGIIVDNLDLSHLPNFIKPHMLDSNCFMEEDERQLYINAPILIATSINITLFTMTAYNIWKIKRGVTEHSAGESRKSEKEKNRFVIYVKLFFVMGINWILEVVSSLFLADSPWWYGVDVFNCLFGIFIFGVFICKKDIIALLCERFSIGSALVKRWETVNSSRTLTTKVNQSGN